jgi:hypothetical protein
MYRPNYRWLADQCRQAAGKATEQERADLLARAKLWDFLADGVLGPLEGI